MAIKNAELGGSDWIAGDVLAAADLNDTFDEEIRRRLDGQWTKVMPYQSGLNQGLIKFAAATWQTNAFRTTDSGVTWSAKAVSGEILASFGAGGVSLVSTTGAAQYTIDSGANWSAASVSLANCSDVYCVDLGSATVGIAAGNAGAGEHGWLTTDGGDNWAQASVGMGVNTRTCCMASATIAYAVDVSKNIWKSTDGGDNWADTNDNLTLGAVHACVAIDTDTVLFLRGVASVAGNGVELYVNSTNTMTALLDDDLTGVGVSNPVLATNGNVYWFRVVGDSTSNILLLYKWDGTYLWFKTLGMFNDLPAGQLIENTHGVIKSCIEVSNVLYFNLGGHDGSIISVDVAES